MNHNKILELLENDARLSVQDLADILRFNQPSLDNKLKNK